jgi:hypothetical protein
MAILIMCCKDKYDPPVSSPQTGYLVVEGYISANGPAEIHLSRTIPLADSVKLTTEALAKVAVQGMDNSSFALAESSKGVYTTTVNLNASQLYRLYIKTKDGKEYTSEYVKVKTAPHIDSVSWVRDTTGVKISINTHDPQNNTWYYRWETEETWEFHSRYFSMLDFSYNSDGEINGLKYRRPDHQVDTTIYYCWHSENSSNILLGSSAKLSQDVIHQQLIFIPNGSWQLSVLYSVNVKQYPLSKEEYEYLQKMKNNSEATGSIFDKQPSELKGNIHCITKPDEPVIGFIGIANRYEQRMWIKNSDVPNWNYRQSCEFMEIAVDSAKYYPQFTPLGYSGPDHYTGGEGICVLCTLRGFNTKPSFWP